MAVEKNTKKEHEADKAILHDLDSCTMTSRKGNMMSQTNVQYHLIHRTNTPQSSDIPVKMPTGESEEEDLEHIPRDVEREEDGIEVGPEKPAGPNTFGHGKEDDQHFYSTI